MRYDRELQKAGKFFVAAVQGDDGQRGRSILKAMRLSSNVEVQLRVKVQSGRLVATVHQVNASSSRSGQGVLLGEVDLED